jgi:hypothetical protein
MKRLKFLSAAAALTLVLPLATSSTSLAAGPGPGPCTQPGNSAVGAAGPAMNAGQLMAGVGQCRRIGSWADARPSWNGGYGEYGYGYGGYNGGPGWGTTGYPRGY